MSSRRPSVLIIASPGPETEGIERAFVHLHWKCHRSFAIDRSVEIISEDCVDVVLFHEEETGRLLHGIRRLAQESCTPVVAIVDKGDVPVAVAALRAGAATALERGSLPLEFVAVASEYLKLEELSAPLPQSDPRDIFVRHERSPLNDLLESFPQIARSDYPVILMGESGTGKELAARVIHQMSPRSAGPFMAVNCGAIAESLLESELFGHRRGAFTGAMEDRAGHFEAAHQGTIFLDEIGTLPLHVQVNFLRVLEEGAVRPVGGNASIAVDFRVIVATNIVLEEAIAAGQFREDLFYRLSVFPVVMPPLRHRPMDIPALVDFFIEEQNAVHGTCIEKLSPTMRATLKKYPWPGNVRELKNLVQRICILKQVGSIQEEDLPPPVMNTHFVDHLGLDVPSEGMDMAGTLERLEDQFLVKALDKAAGNKAKAARLLGLNRTTLVEKLKRKRIDTPVD